MEIKMIKKLSFMSSVLFFLGLSQSYAAQLSDNISRSSGTMYAISATTTPTLILSTGSLVVNPFKYQGNTFNSPNFSTNVVRGQYNFERIHFEIYNDSGHDIWVGFDNQISS